MQTDHSSRLPGSSQTTALWLQQGHGKIFTAQAGGV
jgi:hypothetical protein